MGLFWKAIALALVTLILGLALGQQGKEYALALSAMGCCMIAAVGMQYLEPVLDFLRELEDLGNLRGDLLATLLKAVGIGLTAELAAAVCTDSGNGSLGKQVEILGSAVILYLSIPLFSGLLKLIQEILGEV